MSQDNRLALWNPGRSLLTQLDIVIGFRILVRLGHTAERARNLTGIYDQSSEEFVTDAIYKAHKESQET